MSRATFVDDGVTVIPFLVGTVWAGVHSDGV